MATAPDLPARLQAALKSLQMYSATHARTAAAIEELATWLHRHLASRPVLHLSVVGGQILLDGVPAQAGSEPVGAELSRRGVSGLLFHRGITARELQELLLALEAKPQRLLDLGGLGALLQAHHCSHIEVASFQGAVAQPQPPPADSQSQRIDLDFDGPPAPQNLPPLRPLPPEPSGATLDQQLEAQVRQGFQEATPEEASRLVAALLEHGLHEAFFQALEQLLVALEGPDARSAERAARQIGGLAGLEGRAFPPGTLALLLGAVSGRLLKESSPAFRAAGIHALAALLGALGAQGETAAAEGQIARMRSPEEPAWEALLPAVLEDPALIEPVLQAVFREGRGLLEERALPYLRLLGTPGARLLTRALGDEGSRNRRNRILELLRGLGKSAIPALRACLEEGPWYLTRNAVNLLGELGDAEGLAVFRQALAHSDVRVRRSAVRSIWKACGPEAGPVLLELLPRTDSETQVEVLFGLGQVRCEAAIPAIGALASQAPEALRIPALEALGRIGHPSALPILAEHLRRKGRIFKTAESPEVRLAAAKALVALGSAEAIDLVGRTLAEEPRNGHQDVLRKALETRAW